MTRGPVRSWCWLGVAFLWAWIGCARIVEVTPVDALSEAEAAPESQDEVLDVAYEGAPGESDPALEPVPEPVEEWGPEVAEEAAPEPPEEALQEPAPEVEPPTEVAEEAGPESLPEVAEELEPEAACPPQPCDPAEHPDLVPGLCQRVGWDGVACACAVVAKGYKEPCDDGDPCTWEDFCTPDGACEGLSIPAMCDDGNQCTADSCVPQEGCRHELNSAPCDDGNPCTKDDHCLAGACSGGAFDPACYACDPAEPAACEVAWGDGNPCNGVLVCQAGQCLVDPASIVSCDSFHDTACLKHVCDPDSGACQVMAIVDGTACVDGDNCTRYDACLDGACVGSVDPTIPGCACGDDVECELYEDGDLCNGTLACLGGRCLVVPESVVPPCDEALDTQCRRNACQPASGACGLVDKPDDIPCDDADACSLEELCQSGECVPQAWVSCSHLDEDCLQGACDPADGTCHAQPAHPDAACLNGDRCALEARCQDGACLTTLVNPCDDQDGCTQDACEPESGACRNDLVPNGAAETCDGVDQDCDGATDEDYQVRETTCGTGACAAFGVTSCVDGAEQDSCVPGAPTGDDADCDGVDDDCDGDTDEHYPTSPTQCGTGACAASGFLTCVGGAEQDSCTPGTPGPELCNRVDDDCDGLTDAADAADLLAHDRPACELQAGVCAGLLKDQTLCEFGGWMACDVEFYVGHVADYWFGGESACDDLDNDCDGAVDEDYLGIPTACGVGACARTATMVCQGGQEVDPCQPGDGTAADLACDGVDEDCDGATDEDYAPQPVSCGQGACRRDGTTTCLGGGVKELCTAGAPDLADTVCDGVDEDCDGPTDEDYVPVPTTCGVGACTGWGATYCEQAVVKDSCRSGSGGAEVCDGVDNDCDGLTDADDDVMLPGHPEYALQPVPCEVQLGVCLGARKPLALCAGGTWAPCGAPEYLAHNSFYQGGADASCDGRDNNCEGRTDEDFSPWETTCGVGNCARTGLMSCVQGSLQDSCVPGVPAASDPTCNKVDEDCNGQVDEDFPSVATACGVGACARTGATYCDAGTVKDSCQPAAPSQEACNGADDDCDGFTDEEGALQCVMYYRDYDGDDWGGPGKCLCAPDPDGGYVITLGGDCDDANSLRNPGATEVCNGADDDCDSLTDAADPDLAAATPHPCEKQAGVCAGSYKPVALCTGGAWNQCNQATYAAWSSLYQVNETLCDGYDNDCDGTADEGLPTQTYYRDADGDGYGDASVTVVGCTTPAGYVTNKNDCYDASADAHPGQNLCFATDRGDGSFDYNCNGVGSASGCTPYDDTQASWFCSDVCEVFGGGGWVPDLPRPRCGEVGNWATGCDGCPLLEWFYDQVVKPCH